LGNKVVDGGGGAPRHHSRLLNRRRGITQLHDDREDLSVAEKEIKEIEKVVHGLSHALVGLNVDGMT
jgi:hypothetical protein